VSFIRRAAATALVAASAATSIGCVAVNAPAVGRMSGKQPIVFVHGYTAQNLATWAVAKPAFLAAGYGAGDLIEFNYTSTVEMASVSAANLAPVVQRAAAKSPTGKVDIVAHSEGNLVSETCMLLGGCSGKVDHWVNLTGAQNGTALASANVVPGLFGGGADMNPLSSLVTRLNAAERQGAIQEQGIKTIVFYSVSDGIIIPGDLCKESFAKNVLFAGTHFTVFADPSVLAQSLQFIKT
jgi:triacylglycerol esterase/lipase EstA (alpha/beta hydrolase family)